MTKNSSDTRGQAKFAPTAPIAGEQQVRHGGKEEENRRHQSFGQHAQRQCRPSQIKAKGFLIFQSNEKIVESKGQQEGQQHFRNEDPGEEKNTHTGQDTQGGVERSPFSVGAAAPRPSQDGEASTPRDEREVGSKNVESEEMIIRSGQPIRQRRFFQVTDTIHFQRNPVSAPGHILGGSRMVGVGVVQKRGRKERGNVHRSKDQQQQCPGSPRRKGNRVLGRRFKGKSEVIRHGLQKRDN